jgi:hypothetical protein
MTMRHWISGCGRIELQLTMSDAENASHPGTCDADVYTLSHKPYIRLQLDAIEPALLRDELSDWGAWDDNELTDHEANLQRLLWLAAGDITERE